MASRTGDDGDWVRLIGGDEEVDGVVGVVALDVGEHLLLDQRLEEILVVLPQQTSGFSAHVNSTAVVEGSVLEKQSVYSYTEFLAPHSSFASEHSTHCFPHDACFCVLKEAACRVLWNDGDDIGDTKNKTKTFQSSTRRLEVYYYYWSSNQNSLNRRYLL